MSLQLPQRGAPPPSSDVWPSMPASPSSSSNAPITSASRPRRKSSNNGSNNTAKTRTARPPASPFIVSGKAVSSPLLPSKSRSSAQHLHHHHHYAYNNSHNAGGSSGTGQDEIANMTDVRRLEDMLSHNESLLSNPTLCAQLPGGQANVEARNKAMKDRLEHLYAMHAINIRMQDTRVATHGAKDYADDNDDPFMEDEPEHNVKKEEYDNSSVKKEEDSNVKLEDGREPHAAYSPRLGQSQNRSHINGSPPLSSSPPSGSPGAFHRHWKDNIANRTTMVGKVGQLSMDESLALLQTRANHHLRAQAELERLTAERNGERATHSRRVNGRAMGDIQTVDTNDTEYTIPEEQEDYDWHTEGYYHNDEDDPAS